MAIVADGAPAVLVPVHTAWALDSMTTSQRQVNPDTFVPVQTVLVLMPPAKPILPLDSGLDNRGHPRPRPRDDSSERGSSLLHEDDIGKMDWAEDFDPHLPVPALSASKDTVTESPASPGQQQLLFNNAPATKG